MYLLAKFGDHKSYRNGDVSSFNFYMDTLEKAELTASIRCIGRFIKSGRPTYNSEVPDTAGKKTKRRRAQASAKRFAFYANAIRVITNKIK